MSGEQNRTSWAQPSLSRDFVLLAAAIVFVMLLISAWVTWITYIKHSERVITELQKEADRIERTLETEIQSTGYLLTAIGKQAVLKDTKDLRDIAQLLKSYDTGNPMYAVWTWVDDKKRVAVSSNSGVLEEPVDVADRDYVQMAFGEHWKLEIGTPVQGRVSKRWIIPVSMGFSDSTGKYLGTVGASIDIGALTDLISHIVKREGISFAVVSKTFMPLTAVSDSPDFLVTGLPLQKLSHVDTTKRSSGVMSTASLFGRSSLYSYYLVSGDYPYIIVVSYDGHESEAAIRSLLWPRLIQITVVALFLLSFLWIIRARVIKPVEELGDIAARVAGGEAYTPLEKTGPQEIEQLSMQIGRIADYVTERKRLEDELRSKIGTIQHSYQRLQMEVRQRSALLAALLGEYKQSLRSINGFAQVMKDQLYGPIENKKYKQYAADIHQSGTTLELMIRKLIALARVDSAAVALRDEEVVLAYALENARKFAQEGLPEGQALTLEFPQEDKLPKFHADGVHVQQGLAYVLLYLSQFAPGKPLQCVLKIVGAGKPGEYAVLCIGAGDPAALTDEALRGAVEPDMQPTAADEAVYNQLHWTLGHAMLTQQKIRLALIPGETPWAVVYLPLVRQARLDT